jgi:Holliday junction DNA helicase RuvB
MVGDDAIFGAGPYPRDFVGFVGQHKAKMQLMTAMTSAAKRQAPVDHILLASGIAGIGKTSLAKLVASNLKVGYVELSGVITLKEAQAAVKVLQPRDVLFIDEIHRMVQRGKGNAEWLLHLLQDSVLMTPIGPIQVPPITVIAATTDVGKLPATITSRFPIKPQLVPYSTEEATEIAATQAKRLGFGTDELPLPSSNVWLHQIAAAADYNPREMSSLLITVRDIALGSECDNLRPECGYDVSQALDWNGRTYDGLTQVQQDYLLTLLAMDGQAGQKTLEAAMNEVALGEVERGLIQRGFLLVTPRGRELSDDGVARARVLAEQITTSAVK